VKGLARYPLLVSGLYGAIAEKYTLPSLELLCVAAEKEVEWPERDTLQVFYLDNLMKAIDYQLFQVRFTAGKEAKQMISLFLSVKDGIVVNMSATFEGRSGRGAFSNMLGFLKSLAHTLKIDTRDIDFEIQGFAESHMAYIREHSLSAFVWSERHGRYLHIKENPDKIDAPPRNKAT
jgi:hypothetical protein